jgi:hypothetical protein
MATRCVGRYLFFACSEIKERRFEESDLTISLRPETDKLPRKKMQTS